MPFYLKETTAYDKLESFESVLIVPCRFCPAASLAVSNNEPYFEFFRHFLQTASYERYIGEMRSELETRGVRTDVFQSRWLPQFVICMWTTGRRKELMKRAKNYEALVVLGCEAAVQTIRDALGSPAQPVVQGMRTEGIMSILPHFQWPGSITLQLNSITPVVHQRQNPEPWMRL